MGQLLRLPIQASTHAADIDNMIVLVHWLMLVLFVGWGFFFVFVLFRFRKSANPKADYVGAHGKFAKSIEIAVVVVEAPCCSVPTGVGDAREVPWADAVVVRVVAEQFAWNIQHWAPTEVRGHQARVRGQSDGLDADPRQGDISRNSHVPVNRPGAIHLSSKDVIHSFGPTKCA